MYKNILITGANSPYYESLLTLISTVHDTSFDVVDQIIVYDFGLDKTEVDMLNSLQKVQVKDIDKSFPVYNTISTIKTKCHFLKMFTLFDAKNIGENVLWLDSGACVLNNLNEIYNIIENEHIFLVGDVHLNRNYTHDLCRSIMSATDEELNDRQLWSGLVGFKSNGNHINIINEGWEYSLVEGCIDGYIQDHRHDQSVLSILSSRYKIKTHDIDKYGYWTDVNRNLEKAKEINSVIFAHRRGYSNKANLRYEN